jgi:hypothetical protein
LQQETYDFFQMLIQERQAYFCHQLFGFPPSVICCGHPIERSKQHSLAEAAETVFCNFEYEGSLHFYRIPSSQAVKQHPSIGIHLSSPRQPPYRFMTVKIVPVK